MSSVEHAFYLCAICTIILFVILARDWPSLIKEWTKVDDEMDMNYGFPQDLSKELKIITGVVMLLALGICNIVNFINGNFLCEQFVSVLVLCF